jgi:hypothetical protein
MATLPEEEGGLLYVPNLLKIKNSSGRGYEDFHEL